MSFAESSPLGVMVKPGHLFLLHLLIFLSSLHSPSNSSPSFLGPLVLDDDGGQLCNGTDIPFPFGISGYTSLAPGFNITCNQGNGDLQTSSPRLKLLSDELPIIDMSLNDGFLRVNLGPLNWRCDIRFAEEPRTYRDLLKDSPFTFSSTQNVLTVIGCDAMVFPKS